MHGNFVGLKIQPDLRICLIAYTTDIASKIVSLWTRRTWMVWSLSSCGACTVESVAVAMALAPRMAAAAQALRGTVRLPLH